MLGGLGEGVGLDPHGTGELAAAQHLDQALLGDQALGAQALGRDLVALERLEGIEVDDGVLDPEGVLEALELRDPPGQRHLTALEAGRHRVACALALHAPPRGLAPLAGDPPAHPPLGTGRPRGRAQIMDLHEPSTSSTWTRWGTLAIMPRTSGRSGRVL